MKFLKECPILIGIVTIAVILTAVSFACRGSVYSEYSEEAEFSKVPTLALAFKAARDGVFPWSVGEGAGLADGSGDGTGQGADGSLTGSDGTGAGAGGQIGAEAGIDGSGNAGVDGQGDAGANGNGSAVAGQGDDSGPSWLYGDVNQILGEGYVSGNDAAEEEVYEFTEVDDDYFNDALFIGDSRTVGLSEYCEPLDERATFYAKVSLTIFTVMNKEFIKTDTGKMSVDTALQNNQFGKIYIMLGLNEIGTGDAEYFKNAYEEVINRIRELQPDAIIYIQGIMHVSKKKSEGDKTFTNDKINERNEAIAELANDKDIFYIDMNESVDDGEGNLDGELSFDGVHLKASSYERWHEFLLHNAIVR